MISMMATSTSAPCNISTSLPAAIKLEIMALCKQSMLQLRQKMRIYLRDMHAVYAAAPIDPVIFHVAKEVTYAATVTCYYIMSLDIFWKV